MDAVKIFSQHWLEILIGAYLLGMVLYGHYKGFIRLAVSAMALLITLITVRVAMPYVTGWLKTETPVYQMVQNGLEKAVGLDELLQGPGQGPDAMPGEEIPEGPGTDPSITDRTPEEFEREEGKPAFERMIIEALNLPDQLKHALIENNNGEVYRTLGVELFRDYIGSYLTNMIVQIVVFLLLFLVVFILIHILVVGLDLVARLPILSGMNKIAGALLGGAEGLFFVWIACLIFTVLSGTEVGILIMKQIDGSPWLSFLYHNNLLAKLALGVIQLVL